MSELRTYSPAEVSLSIALLYDIIGFSPDSMITLSKDSGYFNTSTGASGNVERIHTPGNVYTLELSLSQTSPSNTLLTALSTLDDLTRFGVFPIFMKDSSGDSVFLAASCWIENPPDTRYTNSIEERVWEFKCADLVFNLAGNGATSNDEDLAELAGLIGQLRGIFD